MLSVWPDVDTILLIGSGRPEKLGRSLVSETDERVFAVRSSSARKVCLVAEADFIAGEICDRVKKCLEYLSGDSTTRHVE